MKAYITVNKKEIQQGRFNYTEALKALSEEFADSHEALIFSPLPGKLIDVVNHLAENKISYHLDFNRDDNKTEKLLCESEGVDSVHSAIIEYNPVRPALNDVVQENPALNLQRVE